jgi:hypothetical protein
MAIQICSGTIYAVFVRIDVFPFKLQNKNYLSIYGVFRKTCNHFDIWYIHNFLGYRSRWYMKKSSPSWKVCVHVVFMVTHIQYKVLWPHRLTVKGPQSCRLCKVTCHGDLFSNSFNLCLQILNSVQIGAVHTIFDVTTKEIIPWIHVQWIQWPGLSTRKVL